MLEKNHPGHPGEPGLSGRISPHTHAFPQGVHYGFIIMYWFMLIFASRLPPRADTLWVVPRLPSLEHTALTRVEGITSVHFSVGICRRKAEGDGLAVL